METSKGLRERRAEVLAQMEGLKEKMTAEKRSTFSEEERQQFDACDKEQERLLAAAEDMERIERLQGLTLAESRAQLRDAATRPSRPFSTVEDRNNAFKAWFLHGSQHQKRDYWQAAERHGIDVQAPMIHLDWLPLESRGINTVGSAGGGGDIVQVDNQLMTQIDVAMKAYGGMRQVSTIVRTSTGANLPWPTVNDTSNLAVLDAEADGSTAIADQALAFSQNVLHSYRYDSKFVKVSWELMNDSVIDLASFIGKAVGIRIGRALNNDLTNGTGSGQPQGIITGAYAAVTTAANNTISYADLLNLYHAVDPAYRDEPGCGWMFSDSVYHTLRGLVDGNGRPLLMSSLEGIGGQIGGGTLLGKRFTINQQMPAFAASAKVVLFGDLAKYIIRDVGGPEGGVTLLRLNERFADLGLVAFMAFSRHDGMLSDAGTHPVALMTVQA